MIDSFDWTADANNSLSARNPPPRQPATQANRANAINANANAFGRNFAAENTFGAQNQQRTRQQRNDTQEEEEDIDWLNIKPKGGSNNAGPSSGI